MGKKENDRTEKLFVYGTLLKPLMRALLCFRFMRGKPATLQGYRKEGLNVVPDEEEWVPGAIIELSKKELQRIDKYERLPQRYIRKKLAVDGESVWVYLRKH